MITGRESMIPAEFRELCPGSKETLKTYEKSCRRFKKTDIFRSMKKAEEFFEFFRTCLGSDPWEIQRVWARRILMGTSFAAVAPTGIGKTVLGLILSLFLCRERKRSYLLVPTIMLVEQSKGLLERYAERAGIQPRMIAYRSSLRRVLTERISEGDFDILITTNQFLTRNFGLLEDKRFDFIFVDDVDAMLRASRNLDKVLSLLGAYDEHGRRGVLFIASATGRAGRRTQLLRKVLGFDVGVIRKESIRNVLDVLVRDRTPERVVNLIKTMGAGGLLFLHRMEALNELLPALDQAGIRYRVLRGSDPEAVDSFRRGEYDILVGAAKPYGVLVRGLDLPETVKYAVFYGAPRFEIGLGDVENLPPGMVSLTLTLLSSSLGREALVLAKKLRRNLSNDIVERGRKIVSEALERMRAGERFEGVLMTKELKVVIPDLVSYIQGSGRTSRLLRGRLTRGASFLLEEEELALYFLKRASIYDIEFTSLDQVDLHGLRRELEEDRRRILKGGREGGELLKHILFIVESPNKARTISRFFGKPSVRNVGEAVVYEISTGMEVLTVVATLGHLVDLTTEEGYHGVLIDDRIVPVYRTIKRCRKCNYQFVDGDRCPVCGSDDVKDSRSTIEALVRLAAESSRILIGTDPDTEGEKIAWDVACLLEKVNCNIHRAEFHEVTRKAILQALRELREINENRVRAQIVRRIEDRWIGFELSRRVQEHFKRRNLSAGRAQTPVLGWIVRRTREHEKKIPRSIIRGDGLFLSLDAELEEGPRRARVRILKEEAVEINPPPPFTTGELLREANRILKLSSTKTMQIAQELFESGVITYHRTDSTRVSDAGVRIAEQLLKKDFVPRKWGEGGAHECIRVTRPLSAEELVQLLKEGLLVIRPRITKEHVRLYNLIYRRFLASQCRKAKVRKVTYEIEIDGLRLVEERFVEILDEGWLEHYPWGIPVRRPLPEGEVSVEVKVRRVPAAPLYTQGEIIDEMKRRGIGRPSTYAALLEKLLMRKYVLDVKGKLISTKLGKEVYEFLMERYSDLVRESRTRELEEKMLDVEEGKKNYEEVLREVLWEIREKVGYAGSGSR